MRLYGVIGTIVFLAAVFMVMGRKTLAGKTVNEGDVSVTERNLPEEHRLYVIGGGLGALGIIILFVGVTRIESSKSSDKRA